nr:hypothetical protein Iba_chr02bCG14900 [Ipomoea batatas]
MEIDFCAISLLACRCRGTSEVVELLPQETDKNLSICFVFGIGSMMGNISSNSLDLKTCEASEMDAQDFISMIARRISEIVESRKVLSKGFRIPEVVVDRHLIGRENEVSDRHCCRQLA